MTGARVQFCNGLIYDGTRLLRGYQATFEKGQLSDLARDKSPAPGTEIIDLGGDILAPGYVDLQVNGGDGVMLGDAPSVQTLARIANAHRRLGCRWILPTLITDTAEKTRDVIDATRQAIDHGVDGIAGLHLEGPHLSVARKGAHDAGLIRPMDDADLAVLCEAAEALPVLMVTVAPENVTPAQVTQLAQAGAVVSLGHTDASFDTCMAYVSAGARCATHLFNAMSQLGSREPGLVGAVLASGNLSSGLIADGMHVHPVSMRAAFAAKTGPGEIFLVSDAMAVAGTNLTEFPLEGRRIQRNKGRLTLEDGTLAGADLDLTRALHVLVNQVGIGLEQALHAAISGPAKVIGQTIALESDQNIRSNEMIRISSDLMHATPLA